jgi:ATP-binding cassette subfamily B protein
VASAARAAARQLGATTTGFSGYFVARIGKLLGGRSIAEIAFSPLAVLVVVLCGGVLMAKAGWLTAVDLVPFLVLAVGLNAPLLATTYFLEDLVEGRKAVGRLVEFAAGAPADPVSAEHGGAVELPSTGVLTVVDDTPERVLDRVLASVPPGDVAAVDAEQAVVLGPVGDYLAGGTVVDRAAVERAARAVGVHETIAAFPRGYDSVVGEDVSLSYVEAQRLALARAVVGGRRVVLVDERAFRNDVDALRAAVAELEQRVAVCTVTDSAPVVSGRVVRVPGDAVEPEQPSTEYGKVAR